MLDRLAGIKLGIASGKGGDVSINLRRMRAPALRIIEIRHLGLAKGRRVRQEGLRFRADTTGRWNEPFRHQQAWRLNLSHSLLRLAVLTSP